MGWIWPMGHSFPVPDLDQAFHLTRTRERPGSTSHPSQGGRASQAQREGGGQVGSPALRPLSVVVLFLFQGVSFLSPIGSSFAHMPLFMKYSFDWLITVYLWHHLGRFWLVFWRELMGWPQVPSESGDSGFQPWTALSAGQGLSSSTSVAWLCSCEILPLVSPRKQSSTKNLVY